VFRRLPLLALMVSFWLVLANPMRAQRVQFPSAAPAFNPPPTPAPVLPSFDPYGNPLLGTPPAEVPYSVPSQLGQPTPPLGQSVVPQFGGPPTLPPGAPVGSPGIPQSGGSLYPTGLPYQNGNQEPISTKTRTAAMPAYSD